MLKTSAEIHAACNKYMTYERELAITIQPDGFLAVGVYIPSTGRRVSGTLFASWRGVLLLIARMERESYSFVTFVREG